MILRTVFLIFRNKNSGQYLFNPKVNFSVVVNKMSAETSWKAPPPSKVGAIIQEIDTPALVVDLNLLDSNLKKMKEFMNKYPGIKVRPHAKAHKCPAIGKLQVSHLQKT